MCFVSIDMKLKALNRLNKGESVKTVASDLNVGRSTVCGWKKTRRDIESWYAKRMCAESFGERKSMRSSEYEKVSEALYHWFSLQREEGTRISGHVLQEKALQFYKEFNEEGETGFTASSGWLDKWKQRYGVKQRGSGGEKLSAKPTSVSDVNFRFHPVIKKKDLGEP